MNERELPLSHHELQASLISGAKLQNASYTQIAHYPWVRQIFLGSFVV